MTLVRWRPFGISDFHTEMNRLMDTVWDRNRGEDGRNGAWAPAVDLAETKKELILRAELFGLNREDIKVSVDENVLTLHGEKRHEEKEEGEQSYRSERVYGSFRRSFPLPSNVDADQIAATYKDGVLSVTLAKVEEAKPKEIAVQ